MKKVLVFWLSSVFVALWIVVAQAPSVHAQAAWTPPDRIQNLYDPAEITCTNAYDIIKARTTQQGARLQQIELEHAACMEGYANHGDSNWCTNRNYGTNPLGRAQTTACQVGSERYGPDVVKFCSARHSVGLSSNAQNKGFEACRQGFEGGEGACNQLYPATDSTKARLNEACIEGSKGKLYATAAAANQQAASTPPGPPQLGPTPTKSAISDMAPGSNEVAAREVCSLEGFFGTMTCSLLSILGSMADASLAMLGSFMKVDPLIASPDDPLFSYWKSFQTIANVIFVIALLVIVYSHITGAGLSNYSLKKMLPRLIVGAVLINMSFYVCAAAVDLSNIVGSTVYSTLKESIAPPAPTPVQEDKNQAPMRTTPVINPETGEEITWSKIVNWMAYAASTSAVAGVAAGAGAGLLMNGGLAAFIPIIIGVVLAIMIVVLCLLLRQVLIIAFIVISPLAIAAFLLPNTKPLFDRWLKSFIPLLMLFPVIAFVFGIGAVVSEILAAAAFAKPGFVEQSLFVLVALAVQILPLLAVPKLMAIGGGLLAQLANVARGRTDGLNKKAKSFAERQRKLGDTKALLKPTKFNAIRRMRAEHEAKNEFADHALTSAQKKQNPAVQALSQGMQDTPPVPSSATPPPSEPVAPGDVVDSGEGVDIVTDESASNAAAPVVMQSSTASDDGFTKEFHVAAKGRAAQVKARIDRFENEHKKRQELLDMATQKTNEDPLSVEAAISKLASVGDLGAILEMVKSSHTMTREQRHALVNGINSSGVGVSAAPMLGNQTAQNNILNGTVHGDTTDSSGVTIPSNLGSQIVAPSLQSDDYSAESMTSLDVDVAKEINAAINEAARHGIRQDDIAEIGYAADAALSNGNTDRKVTKQRAELEKMRGYHR